MVILSCKVFAGDMEPNVQRCFRQTQTVQFLPNLQKRRYPAERRGKHVDRNRTSGVTPHPRWTDGGLCCVQGVFAASPPDKARPPVPAAAGLPRPPFPHTRKPALRCSARRAFERRGENEKRGGIYVNTNCGAFGLSPQTERGTVKSRMGRLQLCCDAIIPHFCKKMLDGF